MASILKWTDSSEFLPVLWASPTFLPAIGWIILVGACVVTLVAWPIAARLRGRTQRAVTSVHGASEGAVLAADLILVMIPFIVIMLVMTQTMWLMRETVIVHYAAFNAARSARVHLCPPVPEISFTAMFATGDNGGCTGRQEPAEFAARMSLVSASPPWGIPCLGHCEVPETVLRAIARNTGTNPQTNAILDQARYAFDRENVRLSVEFDPLYIAVMVKPGAMPPVRAKLTFRNYVIYGLGPMFGTRRPDGYYYQETAAEVTVL